MKTFPFIMTLLLLAGCDAIPADPGGTLDHVRASRVFKVGLIASAAPVGADRQALFLREVAQATGARPAMEIGASEPLLTKLEEGEVDLVVGEFAPNSPWAKQVTLLPLLGEQVSLREGHVLVRAAARNGENEWISLLEAKARKVAGRP